MDMYPEQIITSSLKEAVLHVYNFYSYFLTTAAAIAIATVTTTTTTTTTTTNNNNNNNSDNNNNHFFKLTYTLRREANANTTFVAVLFS